MTLNGKCVLITGGGTGVGADLAAGFARAGARVVIAGRRAQVLDDLARQHKGMRAFPADVTKEADVARLFAEAGPVDIVIANAGAAESAPFGRVSLEHWNAMLAANLTSVFLTFRAGLNQMQGWGRLIAIASTAGVKGYAYVAPYAAAKHGVIGLTRSLAIEVGARPVTVNAICPGFLDTDMTQRSLDTIMQKTGRSREQALESLVSMNPQRRLIAPAEVTSTALFLCTAGSESLNGQAITLSGGEV